MITAIALLLISVIVIFVEIVSYRHNLRIERLEREIDLHKDYIANLTNNQYDLSKVVGELADSCLTILKRVDKPDK